MTSSPAAVLDDLTFRRQFFLGPEFPAFLVGWERHRVNDQLCLSVHPDLPHTRAHIDGRTLILLGYALDPQHPGRDDQDIVDGALRQGTTLDRLLTAFHPLAGRWAAIFVGHEQTVAFHDTTGSRQIFHCEGHDGRVQLASSAGLLARVTGRRQATKSLQRLERENVFRERFIHFWPGDGSAFIGISRLLPNHYLELATGDITRFWPNAPIPQVDPDEASAFSINTLTGAISAAATRYPLALSLSAGFDSRLLLAACRPLTPDLTFYSYKKTGMTSRSPDVRLPRKILGDLGLQHKVITVPTLPSEHVARAISKSVIPTHAATVSQASALLRDPPRADGNWVTLNGNVAEVAQCRMRRLPVTPENLANALRMPDSSFAMEHLAKWHGRGSGAFERAGVDPWDMLYWEQLMGGWYATVRTEFDVSEEVVTPYNSRAWLEVMFGVDPALRSAPTWSFFRDLIGEMWPQLLDYPFNPPDKVGVLYNRLRSRAKGLIRATRPTSHSPYPHS